MWRMIALPTALLLLTMYSAVIGLPHWLTDWFWRPQFVQACIIGSGGRMDDVILRACNAAWDRRVQIADNGWRPTGD